MAEEFVQGSPAPVAAPDDSKPQTPDRYAGKTPEDLIRMLEEREQTISKQGTDVGDLKKEVERTREELRALALEQRARESQFGAMPQGFAPPVPSAPPVAHEEEFDYTKPVESIKRVLMPEIKAEIDRREQARVMYEQRMAFERAKMNFLEGREAAMSNKAPLFEGIERDVEDGIYQAWNDGRINADSLRQPKTWVRMAQLIRLERGEEDKVAYKRAAVAPPVSDVPTQVKPGFGVAGAAPDFDEFSDAMLKGLGAAAGIKNREEAAELLRGTARK